MDEKNKNWKWCRVQAFVDPEGMRWGSLECPLEKADHEAESIERQDETIVAVEVLDDGSKEIYLFPFEACKWVLVSKKSL